jgi:hypothetical protein
VDGYLLKPVPLELLIEKVATLVAQRAAEDKAAAG